MIFTIIVHSLELHSHKIHLGSLRNSNVPSTSILGKDLKSFCCMSQIVLAVECRFAFDMSVNHLV